MRMKRTEPKKVSGGRRAAGGEGVSLTAARLLLPALFCLLVGCAAQDKNVKALRAGYDALNAHEYDRAMSAADQVLAANPEKTLPAEAHYLRGRVFEARATSDATPAATGDWQKARD